MAFPVVGPRGPDEDQGLSYAGVFVRADRTDLRAHLAVQRFSGWLGPQESRWVLVVPDRADGRVATGGLDVVGLARSLAGNLATVVVVARVRSDHLLLLNAWERELDLGAYVSDPSVDAPDPDEVLPDPVGAEHAERYATACGRPEVATELHDVLAEFLDPESVFESERLMQVLTLLGLPGWLVSAPSLPGDVPAGPARSELERLRAGRPGVSGRIVGALVGTARRRRRPAHPPIS